MKRVAHFVSAFPVLSETFVLDEIEAFAQSGFENVVVSLRPAPKGGSSATASDSLLSRLGIVSVLLPAFSILTPLKTLALSPHRAFPARFSLLGAGVRHPSEFLKMAMTASRTLEIAEDLNKLGVCHCHAHFAHYPASLAWGCSRILGTPFSFNAHSYDLELYRAHLPTKIRDADRMFPISDHNRMILQGVNPLLDEIEERIEVIRCGIRLGDYTLRNSPGLNHREGEKQVILGVGRLVDTKGFADLVEAAALLKRDGFPVEVRIVGEGPERKNLEALIEGNGLADTVNLLGALSREETCKEQREADIVAQPCRSGRDGLDGIPVVLMEAMALGVPVVSTRFAAIPELIEEGRNGVLVDPGRPDQLAHALSQLLRSPEMSATLAAEGRITIERDYNAAKNYRKKCQTLLSLLD